MSSQSFDLEEKRLIKEVQKRKAGLVLIQLPEGLKPLGPRLAAAVETTGALAILSADPCYGACDLATAEAERLGADLIVHYGHSEMLRQKAFSALYIEAKAKISVKDAVRRAIPHLEAWRRIGLVATVQHVHKLDEAEVDAFLFVGGGRFHAIGVTLATAKPTIAADPYERKAFSIESEARRILKKRWASIHEATQAKKVGVLVGLKAGQKRLDLALRIKESVESAGKKAIILALKEITPEALMQFPTIGAFVNTACPRLSLDDEGEFRKPLLTPDEILVVLGKLRWEELCQKGWFES